MDHLLTSEEFFQTRISPYFKSLNIPDPISVILQDNSQIFTPITWKNGFNLIKAKIGTQKYLYMFLKMNDSDIQMIYIGKSTQKGITRLNQHLDGLQSEHTKSNPNNFLYFRMYPKIFKHNVDMKIYLIIIPWSHDLILRNVLKFDFPVNLSNGEALLISRFSHFYPGDTINHEFVSRTKWIQNNIEIPADAKKELINIDGKNPEDLWNNWIRFWALNSDYSPSQIKNESLPIIEGINHIPLFDLKKGEKSKVEFISKNNKKKFCRNIQMEKNVMDAVIRVRKSFLYYKENEKSEFTLFTDGLIYMVYILRRDLISFLNKNKSKLHEEILQTSPVSSEIIPIYIGKTEMLGRNLDYSANLEGVDDNKNKSYFARWGNDSARHIGGLSCQFFGEINNYPSTDYEHWNKIIFDPDLRPKEPQLLLPVYFRMKPWYPYNITFAEQVGLHTPELETQLVALGIHLFPIAMGNSKRSS